MSIGRLLQMDHLRQPFALHHTADASRREFIRGALATVAAAAGLRCPALMAADSPKLTTAAKPVVVHTVSPYVCTAQHIEHTIVRDFIDEGLRALTGVANTPDAWHRVLKPSDRILIKASQSAREKIGTTPTLIDEILRSLVTAGFDLEKITVLEARPTGLVPRTKPADLRWQGKVVDFGQSGRDSFIAALDQADVIINVPYLKTHPLATMSGCLKNLSHGLIRHPARFHANGCDPAIGEIVGCGEIRPRLRLNIVNALRVIFDKGPDAGLREIHPAGGLLFALDPVACDAVGFSILNNIRALHQLGPILGGAGLPRQLATASRLGLGQADGERISLQRIEL